MPSRDYELLDFGDGEKLERFGDYLVRRPNLYARTRRKSNELWEQANLRFQAGQGSASGKWSRLMREPNGKSLVDQIEQGGLADWSIEIGDATFQLKPTPVGHIGVFPEQQSNWSWLKRHVQPIAKKAKRITGQDDQTAATDSGNSLKALNLFAYTGGSTIALAKCGVEVVHLDGAANTVKWARHNAGLSGVAQDVRWITEDALRFVHREIKRKNHYDILVADPPSFGRGPKKEQWRIARDMPLLFDAIVELMPNPKAIILSCHTEGFDRFEMGDMLRDRFQRYDQVPEGEFEQLKLQLTAADGRKLDAGECTRWISNEAVVQSANGTLNGGETS